MGKFSAYKLPLKSLPEGIHEYTFHHGKQFFLDMESPDVRDADLDVSVTVVHKSDIYDLSIAISGEITLVCDRCLDEMPWPVDTAYHIAVKYGEEYNDDSDELLEIPESDNFLNVAYMIYDTVELTIPIKHVHPLGKCNRAMSQLLRKHRAPGQTLGDDEESALDDIDAELDSADDIGSDIPSDPRWDQLRNLSDNN